MLNFPKQFLNRMSELLKDDYSAFLNSLKQEEVKAIYVNSNKMDKDKFLSIIDFKTEPISYEPSGFYVDNLKKGKHPLHHAGAFYIQEPSAMFTANAYKFKGNEIVLDMCAAPGGKTIQIANKLQNGFLISNEIDKSRAEVLFSNVERMGLKNVAISNDSPENLAKSYANFFDVCLVDAPCSGEGMFRRGQQLIDEWNENLPKMCAKRQIEILEHANQCLKNGGILIYSTCTYSYDENEGVVNEFLTRHNYKLKNISAPFSRGIGLDEAVRLYPHINRGEGQFVAVLEKQEPNVLSSSSAVKLKRDLKAENFINPFLSTSLSLYDYKNNIYSIKDVNLIKKGVNFLSLGVCVASIKENVIKTHHNLFSAYGREFKKQLNLDYNSVLASKYLRGETLNNEDKDGYGAVLFNNCPVGGYKISAQKFKNLYPKGLRNS